MNFITNSTGQIEPISTYSQARHSSSGAWNSSPTRTVSSTCVAWSLVGGRSRRRSSLTHPPPNSSPSGVTHSMTSSRSVRRKRRRATKAALRPCRFVLGLGRKLLVMDNIDNDGDAANAEETYDDLSEGHHAKQRGLTPTAQLLCTDDTWASEGQLPGALSKV